MSVAKKYVSVASCERTLRQLIRNYPPLGEWEGGTEDWRKDGHKALSLLVELAVLGVKYKNENNCVLKSSLKLEGE